MSMEVSSTQESSEKEKISSPKQTMSELNNEFGLRSACSEPLEQKLDIVNENVPNGPAKTTTAEFSCVDIEQLRPVPEEMTTNSSCEQVKPAAEDAAMDSNLGQFELLPKDAIEGIPSLKQTTSELIPEFGSESLHGESVEQKQAIGSEDVQNRQADTRMAESDCMDVEQSGLPPEHVTGSSMLPDVEQSGLPSEHATGNSSCEQLRPPPQDVAMKSCLEQLGSPEDATMNSNLEQLGHPFDSASQKPCLEQIGSPLPDADKNPRELEHRDKRTYAKSRKGKYAVSPSVGCTRVLRSRSQEKPKAQEPVNTLAEHGANEEKKKRKKKKIQKRRTTVNEFSRIRNHLRYLLSRMSYEQNLIVVYSGEGWKGQSLEKVKPEKELERAKSDIFRLKLKMRDLFQRLDLLCAEGRLPESLFDSEGEISSEDIFCAKCGSKDLAADNDIILCDGACERGFHQFCLEPPLLKEDIPPDDEGWLCPGCDCKVDCIDLLNESQGTNISITDSWEKVFPEAAAGNKLDDASGFPSDDSEDDDYDPDGAEVDANVQGDESSSESSDESDFYSASDDFRASPDNEKYLGLPSDDSEDDDYDPSAPDLDEQVKHESSSSDFSSDSEDFSAAFDVNRSSLDQLEPSGGSDGERSKLEGIKEQSLNNESFSLLESNPDQNYSATLSRKRHVERLDYKKLHDETYGNVSSDSSDEDWMESSPKKMKNNSGDVSLVSFNGKTPVVKDGAEGTKHNQGESEHTPKRRACKRPSVEGNNNSSATSNRGSSQPGSSGKSSTRSYKKLGEAASQILSKSFKENQYPERAMKENLAKDSGLTLQQVSKWFENARWSFRHSSQMNSSKVESAPNKGSPSPQKNKSPSEPIPRMFSTDSASNGVENKEPCGTSPSAIRGSNGDAREVMKESSIQKSTTPRTRSKGKLDHQAIDHKSVEESPEQSSLVGSSKAQEARQSGRTKGRKRKYVS